MKKEEAGSHFRHKVTVKWKIIVSLSGAMFYKKKHSLLYLNKKAKSFPYGIWRW